MLYKTLNNEAETTVPTYVQHKQLQRTRQAPIHLSLLHSKHVMRTSSAYGRKRLSDVHDITSVFSVETSIHGLKCWVITRHSEYIIHESWLYFMNFPIHALSHWSIHADPLPDPVSLIGESLDFRFYYFKKQFKASLEQFYNFPVRSVCMWTLDYTFELNLLFQKSSGLRPKN